jgi:hypothetical protein
MVIGVPAFSLRVIALLAFAACATNTSSGRDTPRDSSGAARGDVAHDGQHDFDFHIGTWRTHVRRRLHPLDGGDATWVEYDGTTLVRPVWKGRANLVELVVDGSEGHLELLSLRLYDPDAGTWALHVGNAHDGSMSPPNIGKFEHGRGVFVGRETIAGHDVIVRFTISDITPTSAHFEQELSDDQGKTWVVNWIATDTRTDAK